MADLFIQNTVEYFMLNTVGRCIYTKYCEIFSVEHLEDLFTQNNWKILYVEHWGIHVEHCGKIYKYI